MSACRINYVKMPSNNRRSTGKKRSRIMSNLHKKTYKKNLVHEEENTHVVIHVDEEENTHVVIRADEEENTHVVIRAH